MAKKEEALPSFEDFIPDEPAMDLASIPAQNKLSLSDIGAMVGQGATFGFGDEILGALKAGKEIATSDKELSDFTDLYREYQKQEEAKYAALKEENPYLSMGAELAGGFLIPGGLLAKGGAKALEGASFGKKLLEAAKMGAKVGGLAGAGTSESTLEDVEGLGKDILGGAAGGAIFGTGLSAAGQGISKGIPALIAKSEQADSPLVRNLAAAARKGFEGKKLLTDTAQKEIEEEAQKAASNLEQQIQSVRKEASDDITKLLTEAKEKGALVSPDEEIKEGLTLLGRNLKKEKAVTPTIDAKTARKINTIENKVKKGKLDRATADEEIKKLHESASGVAAEFEQALSAAGSDVSKAPHEMQGILNKLTAFVKGELPPQDAYNLALDLEKLDPKLIPAGLGKAIKSAAKTSADVTLAPEMQRTLSSETAKLRDKLRLGQLTAEEYTAEAGKLLNQYGATPATRAFQKEQDVKLKLAESLLGEGRPDEYLTKEIRDLGFSAPQKIYDIITKDIIGKLSDPSTSGDDARKLMTVLEKNINDLNKTYPELNLNFGSILQKVKDVSQDVTLRKKILSEQGKTDAAATGVLDKLMNVTGYGGAYGIGTAAKIGKSGITKFNNFITSASDVTLMPVAKALQNTPKVDFLGHALEGALNNKSIAAKNAAIFSIMQNPDARKAISGFISEED